jgi:uncharacterized protein (DUF1697 family)
MGAMASYVAFLGGINVGGHRVTMDRLRAEFEALGFSDVSTFIASGNVLFATTASARASERTIETRLADALGYSVPTFVRSTIALRRAVALEPFGTPTPPFTHYIIFLRAAPSAQQRRATEALTNDTDQFEVHGTELHRRVRGGLTDSSVKSNVLAQAIGQPSTTRNTKSLVKLVDRL